MESPFSEKEKRFVLSEAIKTSSVPVEKLVTFINESDVQPIWTEVLMPFGRNLNSCINVWDSLRTGPPTSLAIPAPDRKRKSAPEALEPLQAAPQPKRRQSGADTMIRIQPKPSSNGSPLSFSTPPATQPKKRGRPSKADVEARNAAAIARGEVIPPPRTPAARDSLGGDASTDPGIGSGPSGSFGTLATIAPLVAPGPLPEPRMGASFHSGPSEVETGDMASKKKKRGRPSSRSSKEPKQGEGSFSGLGGQPFANIEEPKPPATKPAEEPSKSPALPLPPKPEEGGITAPAYPAIDTLLSPEPQRSERSGV